MTTPPIIEAERGGDGQWFAKINGVDHPHIKSPYKNVVRRNAAQYVREQAEQAQKMLVIKEVMP